MLQAFLQCFCFRHSQEDEDGMVETRLGDGEDALIVVVSISVKGTDALNVCPETITFITTKEISSYDVSIS